MSETSNRYPNPRYHNLSIDGNNREIMIELINRGSLQGVLMCLANICAEADGNNPDFGWDEDRKLLSQIIPHISN